MKVNAYVLDIMKVFEQEAPNPVCELNYSNAYTLLIAVLLSAQTTDKGVNKATEELFKIADCPQKMLELGEDNLKKYIRTIGLYNNKAKNIILLSKRLINDFGGIVPDNRADLVSLAGVGQKTANVVLNVWFKKPYLAVDTHVMRVSNRLDLSFSDKPDKIEEELMTILPEKYIIRANHWLVLFGRYVCKAQKPNCEQCKISQYCKSKDKNI